MRRCFKFSIQGSQNVSLESWIRAAKFNLKIQIHSEYTIKIQAYYKWNAQPSENEKSNVMIENRMEVLENTFLSPFHDELDAAKLYNIVSGQPVDDSIKENFLSLEEAGTQLMSEYIEIMNTETYSESTMMTSQLSLKVKWNEKAIEIRLQRDIFGKFFQSSYRNNLLKKIF